MKRWGSPGLWRATLRSRTVVDWILSKLCLNDSIKDDFTIQDGMVRAAAGVLAAHANKSDAKCPSLKPRATIEKQKKVSILKRQGDIDHVVDGLRKAGLPRITFRLLPGGAALCAHDVDTELKSGTSN
jgi:hypothetical protein